MTRPSLRTFQTARACATLCAAICAAMTIGAGSALAYPAAAAATASSRGPLAATWQASQLHQSHMPGYKGVPDWGLTIDTAFMLAADGHESAVLANVTKAVGKHILDYAVYKGSSSAGAMSKVLLASAVLEQNPADYGGINVRKRVLALVEPASAGFEAGRLKDSGKHDYSNTLSQALGTLGLSRTGAIAQPVVNYLLDEQCSQGYFTLTETVGKTCDQSSGSPDVDATAFAIQALQAAKADGATVSSADITAAGNWLASVQLKNGSFSEDGGSDAPETNSTGVAAAALAAVGNSSAQAAAEHWVESLQVTVRKAGSGPANTDIGAIAYNAATYKQGIADGLGKQRSEWQRATPQAYFAINPVSLAKLTAP